MSKLDEYCKKEAVRLLAKKESDEENTQGMQVEGQKRMHDQASAAASSASTPLRALKRN